MAFTHFGPRLVVIGPIARYLNTTRVGAPDRASDVSRRHRMQMHLITGQADAVVDEIATLDRSQRRIRVENIGWPLLECRVREQPRELVHAARGHPHGVSCLAQLSRQMNSGRAGRAYD